VSSTALEYNKLFLSVSVLIHSMQKKLKLISLPCSNIEMIVHTLREEHKKDKTPGLVVLPEYLFGIPDVDQIGMINLKHDGSFNIETYQERDRKSISEHITHCLNKLTAVAKETNNHIFFGGHEKIVFGKDEVPAASGFMISPSEKGPALSIVRRKINELAIYIDLKNRDHYIQEARRITHRSMKTITVNGFTVLPLLCYELRKDLGVRGEGKIYDIQELGNMRLTDNEGVSLDHSRLKTADVIAVTAHRLEPENKRPNHNRLKELVKKGIAKKDSHLVITNGDMYRKGPPFYWEHDGRAMQMISGEKPDQSHSTIKSNKHGLVTELLGRGALRYRTKIITKKV